MTEKSSGAMTAQEFWSIHFSTHDSRLLDKDGSCAFADALSAELRKECLRINTERGQTIEKVAIALGRPGLSNVFDDDIVRGIKELRTALTDAQREIKMANDALGGSLAVHLCDRIFTLCTEADRLRDQGAQREAALRKAHEWAAKFPLGDCEASPADINAAEEVSRSCEAAIRGLASPVEGSGQCPLCGSKSADIFEGKCLEYLQHGEPAHIFHWRTTSDEQRSGMCWAGLASPPEGLQSLSQGLSATLNGRIRQEESGTLPGESKGKTLTPATSSPEGQECKKPVWLSGLAQPSPCQRTKGHSGNCDPARCHNSSPPEGKP